VTNDVDTYEPIGPNLRLAIEHAMAETGLSIPTHHSAVADVPYHFEDRLERRLGDLANLRILILEKHDLALSKTIRGDEHDEQQIESIHRSVGLDFELLVQRFRDEMTHVMGDPRRIRQQFLQLIQLLFGELKRVTAARMLAGQR
jgi:hypothetical protein